MIRSQGCQSPRFTRTRSCPPPPRTRSPTRRLFGKTHKVGGFDGSGVRWDGLATSSTLEIVGNQQQRLGGPSFNSSMTHRKSNVRQKIETALSQHREPFALTDLARTRDGYVLKFSGGRVMVVRGCPTAVLDDDAQVAALLAQVHRDFDVVEPSRLARDLLPDSLDRRW